MSFVLRGPGPAAVLFLNEIVAALIAGDPDVSDRACGAAVEAVRFASGLTEHDRTQVLNAALDRFTDAGHSSGLPRDIQDTPIDLHLRVTMLGAIEANTRRPIRSGGAF